MYVIPTYKNVMIGVENSEEGQIVDYDQMIRIIYLPQCNAHCDSHLHPQFTSRCEIFHKQELIGMCLADILLDMGVAAYRR